jgi:hypothetical protein
MDTEHLKTKVKSIVEKATILKNKYINNKNIPITYACIFAHSKEEYDELCDVTRNIGKVLQETPTGIIFRIDPLSTVSGVLELLKIRLPDAKKPGSGYGDFTIPDYPGFKKKYLAKKGFHLTRRENYEFIGISDPESDVGAYFSNPPFDKVIGIR